MFPFYTPWKKSEKSGFPVFSKLYKGNIRKEMGLSQWLKRKNIYEMKTYTEKLSEELDESIW